MGSEGKRSLPALKAEDGCKREPFPSLWQREAGRDLEHD